MKRSPINMAERPQQPRRLAEVWQAAKPAKPIKAAAANELLIYDSIGEDFWTGGGITHQNVVDFIAALPADTAEIVVRINSPGGDVFEGVGIYNALVNSGKRIVVKIDSLAASIASIIAMAGDEISIAGNGQMMIHRAWTFAYGNAEDFLKEAATLESIDGSIIDTYAARTGQTADDLKPMLSAETWLDAKTALEKGFVDKVDELKGKQKESAPDTSAAQQRLNILRQQNENRKRIAALAA